MMLEVNTIVLYGNCHCRAVKFSIVVPEPICGIECNCSICYASGFLHLPVKAQNFILLGGAEQLALYYFNTKVAQHTFCKICGIKPFYRPRSHPEDYSVNIRCLDIPATTVINMTSFNGKNWEENISQFPEQIIEKHKF